MYDVMHEVRPIEAYRYGSLRLFLRSGERRVRVNEEAAFKLKASFDTGEPADAVFRGSFLQLELSALDAMEWVADSRQPSPESETDLELRRCGRLFRGGWLNTMSAMAAPGAAFSLAGLVAWKNAALLLVRDYPEVDDEMRSDVLKALCLLWDDVPDPGTASLADLIDRLRAHRQRPEPTGGGGDAGDSASRVSEHEASERQDDDLPGTHPGPSADPDNSENADGLPGSGTEPDRTGQNEDGSTAGGEP